MRALLLTLTTCLLALPAQAKYSGGTGEPNDPYRIATAADLIALGETPADYDKHFLLTADIDLDPILPGRKVFDRAVIAPDTNDGQDGFQGTSFTGVLDGNAHEISHPTITGGSYLGLFGVLHPGAKIRNLGVADVNITGAGDHIGGLAGYSEGGSTIATSFSAGAVTGTGRYVAGLVAENCGIVTGCYSTSTVKGGSDVGGLVGCSMGDVAQSRSGGAVSGVSYVGGLVGGSYCSRDYGDVTKGRGTLTESYSTSTVSGSQYVGGLIGWNCGTATRSYSTGLVTGESGAGGLVGHNYIWGEVTGCFWDIETSGQAASAGGTGKTTPEMQTTSTFTEAGWDFAGETANGTEDVWKIADGIGYPRLAWEKYSGGSGTAQDPYQIATAGDLIALGETSEDYDKHFILTADIDLDPNLPGRKVFDKAVIAPNTNDIEDGFQGTSFTGVFDGKGRSISHLTIVGGAYLGLFGQLASGAEVKNVSIVLVSIVGSDGAVGGLVGYNWGASVAECYSKGTVSGNHLVGGLVGSNHGTVTHCYSTGAVSGDAAVGGFVGYNIGAVIQCYGTAVVSGNGNRGGLVGRNGEMTPNGPRSGDVTQCFWDTQTSGLTWSSGGGTGKTTAEMQTAKTFLDAGWDFVDETDNGTEDIWKIAEGLDYPRLWWEPYDGRATLVLGRIFTVTLESNPSTGYRWEWVDHQDSIVQQMGEAQFKPRETGDPPLVGAGGWESFDFKAVHQGQMTLKLVYRRPWEEGVEPLKTFSLQVAVP